MTCPLNFHPATTGARCCLHFGLSEKDGAGEGTRTPDPIITNDVLYQLSYTGILLLLRPYQGLSRSFRPDSLRDPALRVPGL